MARPAAVARSPYGIAVKHQSQLMKDRFGGRLRLPQRVAGLAGESRQPAILRRWLLECLEFSLDLDGNHRILAQVTHALPPAPGRVAEPKLEVTPARCTSFLGHEPLAS